MQSLTRLIIAFVACSVLALTTFAGPEAIPQRDSKDKEVVAPAPSCDYSWTGFYIGVNVGYGWGDAATHFEPLPSATSFINLDPTTRQPDPAGIFGGGQLGYNFQLGKFVLGAEADFQGSDMEGTEKTSPIVQFIGAPNNPGTFLEAHEKTDWFGTFRFRVGFTPFCRLLVYGTGGLAYGNVNYSATTDFTTNRGPIYHSSFDNTKVGWTAGGGLEYALTHRWSVKVEYLYYDLGDESSTANASDGRPFQVRYNWETTANTVKGGLNFKF
jgi:outer membrane immunogenic protein